MSSTVKSITDELNNVYPVFEANQVLTSAHLNQMSNYFDTQDRLSRVKLIGVGIVCGLDLSYTSGTITISAGTGITSEGFLIHFPEAMVYTKATEADYADPDGYDPFLDPLDTITGQIDIWELLPSGSGVTDTLELTSGALNIENKAVVLFMEYDDIDLESCLGESCDDKGISRQFTVRALLLNCTDVDTIIRDEYNIPSASLDSSLNARYQPDYMAMKAYTLLDQSDTDYDTAYQSINSESYLNQRYIDLFPTFGANSMHDLGTKIKETYGYYAPILQGLLGALNLDILTTIFNDQRIAVETNRGLQYYYDYSKDLAKAYNEFVDAAFEITAECLPSQELFPRHLVIGKVTSGSGCPENEDDCKPKLYRTHFIQSPIYNQQKDKLAEVRMKFRRIVEMIKGFSKIYSVSDTLKITPSDEKQHEIGLRSIPFYYDSTTIHKFWNYKLSKKCKENWNLGYRAAGYGNAVDSALAPLNHNKDAFNFYRIEGLLDKPFADVKSDLDDLKRKYDLEFDILAFKLETDSSPLSHETNCGIIDIQESYVQLRNEIIAETKKYGWILNKFFYLLMNSDGILADMIGDNKLLDFARFNESDFAAGNMQVENLVASMPLCIEKFELDLFKTAFKEIQEFSFTIAVLFERFIRLLYTANTILGVLLAPILQNELERYFLVNYGFIGSVYDLNDILRSHLDVRMQSIHFSYLERLALIESRKLFSNFAHNNPGIRHMAGVPQGGTFILVYGNETDSTGVVADFAMKGKPCCCEDKFEFCNENVEPYPPSAKNVYYFLNDSLVAGRYVEIDVLEFAIDLNVMPIDLNVMPIDLVGFSSSAISKFGGSIQRSESSNVGRAVVRYQIPTFTSGIDQFEFTIVNTSGKTDKACVFIAQVPIGTNIFANMQAALKELVDDNGGSTGGEDGGTDTTGTTETDTGITGNGTITEGGKRDWGVGLGKGQGLEIATIYDRNIVGGKNRATIFIDETINRYERVKDLGHLGPDPKPVDLAKYEILVVEEFKEGLEKTSSEIDSLNVLIGETPTDPKEALHHRLLNEKKIAERAAILGVYEDQTNELLHVIQSQGLAKTTDSEMYKFIDEDVRKYTETVSGNSLRPKIALQNFGARGNVTGVTKDLFNTF